MREEREEMGTKGRECSGELRRKEIDVDEYG